MRAIKHALTERFYTWQDAAQVATSDPEINLDGKDGQVYTPSAYEDEYEAGANSWAEGGDGAGERSAEQADKTRKEEVPR